VTDLPGAVLLQVNLDTGKVLEVEPMQSRAAARREAKDRNTSPSLRTTPRVVWQVREYGELANLPLGATVHTELIQALSLLLDKADA